MRRVAAAFLVAAAMGCGPGPGSTTCETETEFMNICQGLMSATPTQCQCGWDYLSARRECIDFTQMSEAEVDASCDACGYCELFTTPQT